MHQRERRSHIGMIRIRVAKLSGGFDIGQGISASEAQDTTPSAGVDHHVRREMLVDKLRAASDLLGPTRAHVGTG